MEKKQNANAIDNAGKARVLGFPATSPAVATAEVKAAAPKAAAAEIGKAIAASFKKTPEGRKALRDLRAETEPKPATAAKPKAAKSGKPDETKPEAPARIDKPEHEIELTPTDSQGVYIAKVRGKRAVVVCFGERNRAAASMRYNAVTISDARTAAAKKQAKASSLPLFYGLQIRVAGRWDSGWLISSALFGQYLQSATDFSLSGKARAAYAADASSLLGVKFSIAK